MRLPIETWTKILEKLDALTLTRAVEPTCRELRAATRARFVDALVPVFKKLPQICVGSHKKSNSPCDCFAWGHHSCIAPCFIPILKYDHEKEPQSDAADCQPYLRRMSYRTCKCWTTDRVFVGCVCNTSTYFKRASLTNPPRADDPKDWREFADANALRLFRSVAQNATTYRNFKTTHTRTEREAKQARWIRNVGLASLFPELLVPSSKKVRLGQTPPNRKVEEHLPQRRPRGFYAWRRGSGGTRR